MQFNRLGRQEAGGRRQLLVVNIYKVFKWAMVPAGLLRSAGIFKWGPKVELNCRPNVVDVFFFFSSDSRPLARQTETKTTTTLGINNRMKGRNCGTRKKRKRRKKEEARSIAQRS